MSDEVGWDDATLVRDAPSQQALTSHGQVGRVRLMPMLSELKILTKERGLQRLGDVMNDAQRDFIAEVERQINETGMIRIIVLKARQMGISTVIEGILFLMSILYHNFQTLIISHETESSEHILGMTKRYWDTYPFRDYHTEKYSGRKQLSWSDIESNLTIATAKNTSAGRSKTLHALHASEVAFWDKPDELVTGLRQSIPSFGLTAIFYESTANGIGNFFHQQWLDAESGVSEFVGKFYPWFTHPEYTASYIPSHVKTKYSELNNLTEDELILRAMGVPDERLLWRRWAIPNLCRNDVDVFKQEYPSTPTEAFLTTGRNVFRLPDLLKHYFPVKPDVGYLERRGQQVVFVKHPRGHLKVYRHPSKDKNWGVYLVGADPTHTTVGDYACAQVISRRTLEQVATFRKHMDPTSFARELALLGEYYNWAMIAPEKEGPGYATVGHLLGAGYPLVYESQKVDKTPGKVNHDVFGWGTNSTTKHLAISGLVDLLAQPVQFVGQSAYGLILHDEDTFNEMKNYIVDENGQYMNGNGTKFDDTVMAFGIAHAVHKIEPKLVAYSRDDSVSQLVNDVLTKMQHSREELEHAPAGAPTTGSPDWENWQ